MEEGLTADKKSARFFSGDPNKWDYKSLATDCVAFANARGGTIHLGIEDNSDAPPPDQRIPESAVNLLQRGIARITVNVATDLEIVCYPNGGQVLELRIHASRSAIASTNDARFYLRVADETRKLRHDDLIHLWTDRDAYNWETQTTRQVPRHSADPQKQASFLTYIRSSQRVSSFLKSKSDDELLDHYFMAKEGLLTNLGILWIGRREDRAQLLHAPAIQFIKYDHRGEKIKKIPWLDYDLNPMELMNAVIRDIPDWHDITEIGDGAGRIGIPHYDEVVVRELLANALVHRPYTTCGDIFINLHPDYVEFHNPGLLPIGVTSRNILHASTKRNPHLARVFLDLALMEGEGSGYDVVYASLLKQGRSIPKVEERDDRVVVTVNREIVLPDILKFFRRAERELALSQKETICLGLIAQKQPIKAVELRGILGLRDDEARLRSWLGKLVDKGIVKKAASTKATEYSIAPSALKEFRFVPPTDIKRLEPHRLQALVEEDLKRWPGSGISDIHKRIGEEIRRTSLETALEALLASGRITKAGIRRGTRYSLAVDHLPPALAK